MGLKKQAGWLVLFTFLGLKVDLCPRSPRMLCEHEGAHLQIKEMGLDQVLSSEPSAGAHIANSVILDFEDH